MQPNRRNALALGMGSIALGRQAFAQAGRPTRDVEFVIPFGLGVVTAVRNIAAPVADLELG